MKKTKHTPGPWEIYDFDQTEDHLIQSRSKTADRLVAAAIHEDPTNPTAENQANALLISRAPAMEAALKTVLAILKRLDATDAVQDSYIKNTIEAAEAGLQGAADKLDVVPTNTRIIVEVRGGLVCAVYSNDADIDLDVLDWDAQEECDAEDPHRMKDERFEALQKEIEGLIDIY